MARVLDANPMINVCCNALESNSNYELAQSQNYLGLPAPLFTFNMDAVYGEKLPELAFKQLFDSLEPAFGLQVSLGQMNSVVLCPALTSHSELSDEDLKDAGISRSTIRLAVGDEDPRTLLEHFINVCELTIDKHLPGFSQQFPSREKIDELYRQTYMEIHQRFINSQPAV